MKPVFLSTVLPLLFFAGCASQANRYVIPAGNYIQLKSIGNVQIRVGQFTFSKPNHSSILCRAEGPVHTPDKNPFSEYIRDALIQELKLTGLYSTDASVTITGKITELDFDSYAGLWQLSVTFISQPEKSFSVSEKYAYESYYSADMGCEQTAYGFMPAIQNLLGSLFKHPEFIDLVQ